MRFPEFSGEWESIHLGEISDVTKLAGFEFTEYVRYEDEGEIIALRGLNCKNGSLDLNDVKYIDNSVLEKLIRSKLCIGDILFTYVGTVGEVAIIEENDRFYLAPNVSRIRLRDKYNPYFIKHQLYNKRFYNKVVFPLIATSSQPALSMENVRRFKLNIPTIPEQDKIAKFLNLLDLRISTQRKIIEDLKKLKAAIAEKLFCGPYDEAPELRVANSSASWNLYRLKDVCQRISERNSQESSSLVLTIAAQYGLVSQTDFFNKSVASENLSNYYLIQKGDFAYNKSYSGEYPWGAVKRLELYETGVLSPLYICFKPNPLIVDSDFLSHYFETHKWHNGIAQIAGEGARNHGLLNVSISDYFATLHRLPGLPEQKKIASYLNLLSDIISLANKELKCYSRQKQYLLARMFI